MLENEKTSLTDLYNTGISSGTTVILLSIVLVLALSGLDMLVPPAGIPLALVFIWWMSKTSGGWVSLGLGRPASWPKTLGWGVLLGVGLQTFFILGLEPGLEPFFGKQDTSSFESFKGNVGNLVLFLIVSWTTAGMGEEIIWRGFLLPRIAQLFGGGKSAWLLSIVVAALLFGLLHLRFGAAGIIQTGVVGLVFGVLFIATRRNLWLLFIAHGVMDTIAFVVLFLGVETA